ncbi:hypothetical protein LCGC14_0971430 [marine sediment metagenome]|uniref:Putative regulatory protein FmdB zinc ribbon domain-containing protein n=1 Tax=marine sediment metagenome TaxID=412755 RepID=A0A0F9QUQ9_9ZZZZ
MPNYEYRCESCEHRFEKRQAFGEEPITTCPECEGVLVRVIHPVPAIFKGGKPSAGKRTQKVGTRDVPIHQTEEGHWEQDRIMDQR